MNPDLVLFVLSYLDVDDLINIENTLLEPYLYHPIVWKDKIINNIKITRYPINALKLGSNIINENIKLLKFPKLLTHLYLTGYGNITNSSLTFLSSITHLITFTPIIWRSITD